MGAGRGKKKYLESKSGTPIRWTRNGPFGTGGGLKNKKTTKFERSIVSCGGVARQWGGKRQVNFDGGINRASKKTESQAHPEQSWEKKLQRKAGTWPASHYFKKGPGHLKVQRSPFWSISMTEQPAHSRWVSWAQLASDGQIPGGSIL